MCVQSLLYQCDILFSRSRAYAYHFYRNVFSIQELLQADVLLFRLPLVPVKKGATHTYGVIPVSEHLENTTAEKMPHTNETHFQFYQKKDVYQLFLADSVFIHRAGTAPSSLCYFLPTLKEYCKLVKVRRTVRILLFVTCVPLCWVFSKYARQQFDFSVFIRERQIHIKMIVKERRAYQKKNKKICVAPRRVAQF